MEFADHETTGIIGVLTLLDVENPLS